MKRYQKGFPEGVKCVLADSNPELIPIVDMGSFNVMGNLVGFAVGDKEADIMINALNVYEGMCKSYIILNKD